MNRSEKLFSEYRELYERLSEYENGPCNFDHHGYCQDHPGEQEVGDCAIIEAREFLERYR
jgi:hypothetical protein